MNAFMYSMLCAFLFLCPQCRCNVSSDTVKVDRNRFAFNPTKTNETVNIKITEILLPVSMADGIRQLRLTAGSSKTLYCVSDQRNSDLRFKAVISNTLTTELFDTSLGPPKVMDLTRKANFSSSMLTFNRVRPELHNVTIVCEQRVNGKVYTSEPVELYVYYLRNVTIGHLNNDTTTYVDNNVVYIECIKDAAGKCQGQNATITCLADANPRLEYGDYNWWQNGHLIGHGNRLAINPEMSGSAIQCSVNDFSNRDRPIMSQTLMIQAYSSAHLLQVAKINQNLTLTCVLEGTMKQHAIWKMRRPNGLVTTAPCLPEAKELRYIPNTSYHRSITKDSLKRMLSTCELHVTDDSYTGQYWCCADNSAPNCLQSGQDKKVAEVEVQGADFNVGTTTAR